MSFMLSSVYDSIDYNPCVESYSNGYNSDVNQGVGYKWYQSLPSSDMASTDSITAIPWYFTTMDPSLPPQQVCNPTLYYPVEYRPPEPPPLLPHSNSSFTCVDTPPIYIYSCPYQQPTPPNTPQLTTSTSTMLQSPSTSISFFLPDVVRNVIESKLFDEFPERKTASLDEKVSGDVVIGASALGANDDGIGVVSVLDARFDKMEGVSAGESVDTLDFSFPDGPDKFIQTTDRILLSMEEIKQLLLEMYPSRKRGEVITTHKADTTQGEDDKHGDAMICDTNVVEEDVKVVVNEDSENCEKVIERDDVSCKMATQSAHEDSGMQGDFNAGVGAGDTLVMTGSFAGNTGIDSEKLASNENGAGESMKFVGEVIENQITPKIGVFGDEASEAHVFNDLGSSKISVETAKRSEVSEGDGNINEGTDSLRDLLSIIGNSETVVSGSTEAIDNKVLYADQDVISRDHQILTTGRENMLIESTDHAGHNELKVEAFCGIVSVKKRRALEAKKILQKKRNATAALGSESETSRVIEAKPSLLVQESQLKRDLPEVTPREHMVQQEKEMMKHLSDCKTLMSVREFSKGITYSEPLPTGWKPLLPIRRMSKKTCDAIRKQWHIIVDGDDTPPPIKNFKDMRFPEPILRKLAQEGIVQPTPFQVQGLPVILSGSDMIGIAFTGSGKTLVFVLPLIMMAVREELMMPIFPGEGPFGLIICPSRELARQTYDVVEEFLASIREYNYPEIRPLLCIGGVDMLSQLDVVKKGVHIVVTTPERLKDMLAKKKMNLDNCRYLTLDEADRLVDLGFEDDIREVFDHFKGAADFDIFINFTILHKINEVAVGIISAKIGVKIFDPGGYGCYQVLVQHAILEDKNFLKGDGL